MRFSSFSSSYNKAVPRPPYNYTSALTDSQSQQCRLPSVMNHRVYRGNSKGRTLNLLPIELEIPDKHIRRLPLMLTELGRVDTDTTTLVNGRRLPNRNERSTVTIYPLRNTLSSVSRL